MAIDDLIYELICDNCGEEYSVTTYETAEIPQYCPFCGHEIDVSEFEDEDDLDDDDEDQSNYDEY